MNIPECREMEHLAETLSHWLMDEANGRDAEMYALGFSAASIATALQKRIREAERAMPRLIDLPIDGKVSSLGSLVKK